MTRVEHPFEPVFDAGSRVLILGSLPSVDSRRQGFYYGHPRNRFWPVLSQVLGAPAPGTIPEKREMLLRYGVALYDVIAACDIEGSSDAAIRNAVAADLTPIFEAAPIRAVFLNGKTAWRLYEKNQKARWPAPAFCLPSTSPANAAWTQRRLVCAYRTILDYLDGTK